MKANASQGSGAKAKKKTSYAAQYKKMTGVAPRQKTKTESVSSVTAGIKTNRVSDKRKAATRSMVANAALMVVPGGAAIKGARAVANVAKTSKAMGSVKGAVNYNRAVKLTKKANDLEASGATWASKSKFVKAQKTRDKAAKSYEKAVKELNSPKVTAKLEARTSRAIRSKQISGTRPLTKREPIRLPSEPRKITTSDARRRAMRASAGDVGRSPAAIKKIVKSNNKNTLKKLKSSGAIKRMK
jgi:hypothetical protein